LAKLRELEFAKSDSAGRARVWRLNTDSTVIRSWLEETQGAAARGLGRPQATDALGDLASALKSMIAASHELYAENAGEPAPSSTAAMEVEEHDQHLAEVSGTPRPVFGAYVDAEAKLRALIDLASSFSILVVDANTSVGQVVLARAAIETAARMYWGLAVGHDYRERASRWLRERLRTIHEVTKFGRQARLDMEESRLARDISEGARQAGLNVPGPPPAAIDLIWPLVTATESPLEFDGVDRETAMLLLYRTPSAVIHGAPHGVRAHFRDPKDDQSRRSTNFQSVEGSLFLIAGLLNGFANAHGALISLYGWDATRLVEAESAAAQTLSAALQYTRSGPPMGSG
jgi:hypothetical protein